MGDVSFKAGAGSDLFSGEADRAWSGDGVDGLRRSAGEGDCGRVGLGAGGFGAAVFGARKFRMLCWDLLVLLEGWSLLEGLALLGA